MEIQEQDNRPIYLQVAEWIKDAILSGAFAEEEQIPSTTEISMTYRINPATALKGINLLVDEGMIYKKRGIGMFVKEGARERLRENRKSEFYERWILSLVEEAKRIGLGYEDIEHLIRKGYQHD